MCDITKMWRKEIFIKNENMALASVAQLVGELSRNRQVVGSISHQGTYLGYRFIPCTIPSPGTYGRQLVIASLSHQCFSLSFPLSLSKQWKKGPQVRIKKIKMYAFDLEGISRTLALRNQHTDAQENMCKNVNILFKITAS